MTAFGRTRGLRKESVTSLGYAATLAPFGGAAGGERGRPDDKTPLQPRATLHASRAGHARRSGQGLMLAHPDAHAPAEPAAGRASAVRVVVLWRSYLPYSMDRLRDLTVRQTSIGVEAVG